MFDLSWKKNVKMKIFFEQVWMEKENKAKTKIRNCQKESQDFKYMYTVY